MEKGGGGRSWGEWPAGHPCCALILWIPTAWCGHWEGPAGQGWPGKREVGRAGTGMETSMGTGSAQPACARRPFPLLRVILVALGHSLCPAPSPHSRSIPAPQDWRCAAGHRHRVAVEGSAGARPSPLCRRLPEAPGIPEVPGPAARDPGGSRSRRCPPVLPPHRHTGALTIWAGPSLPHLPLPRRVTQGLHS